VNPMAAGPITMAFLRRVAVETIVVLRVVKATLAIFIEPGVGCSACHAPGERKAHHENENPIHVWPDPSRHVTAKNCPRWGKFLVHDRSPVTLRLRLASARIGQLSLLNGCLA
jgi:hypothetical protein